MKTINNIIKLLGIATILLLLAMLVAYINPIQWIVYVSYALILLIGIVLYKLSVAHEKRLESERDAMEHERDVYKKRNENSVQQICDLKNDIDKLEKDFANQVKATEEAEKERDNYKEKFKQFSNAYDEPFSEDSQPQEQGYVCTECGKPMTRMTDKTVFCDNIECTRKRFKRTQLESTKINFNKGEFR